MSTQHEDKIDLDQLEEDLMLIESAIDLPEHQRAFERVAALARKAQGPAIPALVWTDPMPPTKGSHPYDHVAAQTPFGEILITWKGWKDYPSYCVDTHPLPEYFYSGNTLEDAKENAERAYLDALAASGVAPQEPAVKRADLLDQVLAHFRNEHAEHWSPEVVEIIEGIVAAAPPRPNIFSLARYEPNPAEPSRDTPGMRCAAGGEYVRVDEVERLYGIYGVAKETTHV